MIEELSAASRNNGQPDEARPLRFGEEGDYHHFSWRVMLREDTSAGVAQMVSLHEGFHSDLDRATDYGCLLTVYGSLALNLPDAHYKKVHRRLLDYARSTHETYATYLSVLFLAVNQVAQPSVLIEALSGYKTHYQLGERLVRGLRGNYLRMHAAMSALRVCMQGPVSQQALAIGLDRFLVRDLGTRNLPDERLRAITEFVTGEPNFWLSVIEQARSQRPDWRLWEPILASEQDDSLFNQLLDEDPDEVTAFLLGLFHQAVADRLAEHGLLTLPYDGHLPFIEPLAEAAHRLAPGNEVVRAQIKSDIEISKQFGSTLYFAAERLVLRAPPPRAELLPLALMPEVDWPELREDIGAGEHFYVATRMPARLLEQYEFSENDRALLESYGDEPVTCVQTRFLIDDEITHALFPLDDPHQLEQLAQVGPLFSNLSMAALADERWAGIWAAALYAHTRATVLFDLSPFQHFYAWHERRALRVKYGLINLAEAEGRFSTLACEVEAHGARWLLLAPCTTVVFNALRMYINRLPDQPEQTFAAEPQFIRDNEELLRVALHHLLSKESFFDFQAVPERMLWQEVKNETR